jgi:hypothetical protein
MTCGTLFVEHLNPSILLGCRAIWNSLIAVEHFLWNMKLGRVASAQKTEVRVDQSSIGQQHAAVIYTVGVVRLGLKYRG